MYTAVNENTSFLLIDTRVDNQHIMTPSYEIYSNTLRAPDEGNFYGCPLLVGNTMLMFGGGFDQRQIAEIYSWGSSITRRIGSLLFQFKRGTCLYNNEMFYFCFGMDLSGANFLGAVEETTCRHRYWYHTINFCVSIIIFSSDLVNYGIYPRTSESHLYGAIDIFNNNLVAIGGGWYNATMEMLINERHWLLVPNFGDFLDFSGGKLLKFTTLVIPRNSSDLLYIFGGNYYDHNYDNIVVDKVWLYDNITWTPATPLMRPLSGHYTALVGENVIHYGGSYNYDGFSISKWKLENETFLRPVEFVELPGITLSGRSRG